MRTYAEISKANLVHNLEFLRNLRGDSEILAMVKANAYGHGAIQISKWLREAGVQKFGVATIGEAFDLQKSVGSAEIFLTGGYFDREEIGWIVKNSWVPLVSNIQQLSEMEEEARRQSKRCKIHLKFETGMHRFGLDPKVEVDPQAYSNLTIEGLCTHMALNPNAHPKLHQMQMDAFKAATSKWIRKHGPVKYLHWENTAGLISRNRESDSRMSRIGLGLYGYSSLAGVDVGLQPILTWKAKILQRKYVNAGGHVGYGFTYRAGKGREIAIVGVGYGDGLNRLMSNRGWMLVHGIRCPIVGTVSMDSCAIDVTDVCASQGDGVCEVGRDAVIIGQSGDEKIRADDVGDIIGTVAYEVLTSIGGRVERIYQG